MLGAMLGRRVLFLDLNNSARYPALAVGYLVAVLRRRGFQVDVLSPLAEGVPGFIRDLPDTYLDHLKRRVQFSTHPLVARLHDQLRRAYKGGAARPHPRLLSALDRAMSDQPPDIVLVSAYLDHRPSVEAVSQAAARRGVPVVLGGPVFNDPRIAADWSALEGITHVFGGEADDYLADLCDAVIAGRAPVGPGVFRAGEPLVAPMLTTLDALPHPDFSDFPWALYTSPVLTIMTGRGCEWGRCTFCSDVVTANGRGYRSRPLERVLDEMAALSALYKTKNTMFLDIKLNSDLAVWNGIIDNYQRVLPGGRWIGTVHVAARGDNGLDRERLFAAKASGMARISFGLESGSDDLNRKMGKGTTMARNLQFMQDAKDAGLSVRVSMMLGYPGETHEHVAETAAFLREHGSLLDRVRMARFKPVPGTRFERLYARRPDKFPGMEGFRWRYAEGRADYVYRPAMSPAYRKAKAEVLQQVYRINRRPLPAEASEFNGLM